MTAIEPEASRAVTHGTAVGSGRARRLGLKAHSPGVRPGTPPARKQDGRALACVIFVWQQRTGDTRPD